MTYWQLFRAGGFFMWPLAGSSVLAIAIIIERFITLRRSEVIPPEFMPGLKSVWRDLAADFEQALDSI